MKVAISKYEAWPVYSLFEIKNEEDDSYFQGTYETIVEIPDDLVIKFDKLQQEWVDLQTEISNLFAKSKGTLYET